MWVSGPDDEMSCLAVNGPWVPLLVPLANAGAPPTASVSANTAAETAVAATILRPRISQPPESLETRPFGEQAPIFSWNAEADLAIAGRLVQAAGRVNPRTPAKTSRGASV